MIRDYTDLEILAETEEGDAYLFASKDKRIAFVTGHPEYDAQTLAQEYCRDVEAGLDPDVPYNYFPHNDPQNKPRASWRSHGNLLFTNWLNYYVYQITPYNIPAHESNAGLIFCDSRSLSDSAPYLRHLRVPFLFPKRTSASE